MSLLSGRLSLRSCRRGTVVASLHDLARFADSSSVRLLSRMACDIFMP